MTSVVLLVAPFGFSYLAPFFNAVRRPVHPVHPAHPCTPCTPCT